MSGLGKTRRRIVDISGGYPGMISDRSDQFLKFLESNSEDAFTRPWHRLEKGMRLNRIRRFVDEEALRFQLNEEEKTDLFNMLIKALDKKQLQRVRDAKNSMFMGMIEEKEKEYEIRKANTK
jgi:hypothetical protein